MILSGGLSRRMGEDKSIKQISGKSLMELVLNRSLSQVDKLIINSNKSNVIFDKLGLDIVISDCMSGNLGPLVGILTGVKWALKNSNYKWLATFPIDCPFFPKNIVERFIKESKDYKILVAEGSGRIHPVFSMWKVSIQLENQLELFLKNGERKIDKFTKKFNTKVVKFPKLGYDPFFNVNTLDDLKKAQDIYNQDKRKP